jgi:hypothetical protein
MDATENAQVPGDQSSLRGRFYSAVPPKGLKARYEGEIVTLKADSDHRERHIWQLFERNGALEREQKRIEGGTPS